MAMTTYVEAGRRALTEAMDADPTVWVLGEDVGRGGIFRQYAGLLERYGPTRICDTPIAEATIMGAAVGAALMGTRPVVEMRMSDFALCAVDELVNQAAKARYMFGGQGRVPLVVRQPTGILVAGAAQHGQSLEGWWANVPGLVVCLPSTPADVRSMLLAAIRGDDPVVFMEHKGLWALEGEVPDVPEADPIGRAVVRRPGTDLTVVSWSATVHDCLAAADALAGEGRSVEVIDLRTVWPWDRDTVLASAGRTGRLLVVHEAVQAGGFGAEVAATVAEATGLPVRRLGAARIPVPYAPPLEAEFRVDRTKIAAAMRDAVAG